MSNYFDPMLSCTILFMLAIALIMGIKNYYYKKYRSAKSQGRFLKSFTRWYGQSDMDNDKFPASKKIYMGINNKLNIIFWMLLIIIFISAYYYIRNIIND